MFSNCKLLVSKLIYVIPQNSVVTSWPDMGCYTRHMVTPPTEETLTCSMCATPWHVACLHYSDCFSDPLPSFLVPVDGSSSEILVVIKAIEVDESLTEKEKAEKRQELLMKEKGKDKENGSSILDVLDGSNSFFFIPGS
ncbi:hypothetical protein GOBAR_AA34656 [Gossypium barbadense]|uniref:Zinc finger PHD-type domain-containing protein n=1 Tax=Gossypium barbadense TaxID=3634 RepID=A0A2P5W4N1_GOSBA|nr:hypothetical protein GOBAR_AA34656 [Gossypium barbadense]